MLALLVNVWMAARIVWTRRKVRATDSPRSPRPPNTTSFSGARGAPLRADYHPLMRIAALYDIHGNAPALEAVLAEVLQGGVDLVVVGGDVVFGPMSRDCLALLAGLDVPVRYIQGNAEVAILDEIAGRISARPLREAMREVARWEADQVRQYAPALESW